MSNYYIVVVFFFFFQLHPCPTKQWLNMVYRTYLNYCCSIQLNLSMYTAFSQCSDITNQSVNWLWDQTHEREENLAIFTDAPETANVYYLLVKTFIRAPSSSTIGIALIRAGKENEKDEYIPQNIHIYRTALNRYKNSICIGSW